MGNKTAGLAPFERVAAAIREAISREQLKPGDRLPSNRELAQQHDVSLPTLQRAVALLQDEGWLVSRASVGVYVADEPPTEMPIISLADVRHALTDLRRAVAALEARLDRLEAADQ
ncbi:GntR family transcriptional regulator [Amycolatopsis sp. ATCC 39116]|uniref:GntR family transcriptional regulator n=1 Tax=Amycolatopsis sp. (strain ATCC 39116 / 75iv2) TaxID=385957 RepID=UPI0002626941|nr:winged helix-turn-helix domain-containing protein [Amycolatopsis sp. ATCC 39116]